METHFAKPLIKRTLHNLEQLKQVVFFFAHILIGKVGILPPSQLQRDLSVFASNMLWDLCHISFFSSFFLRRHKKQDPSRGAYRETKSYQRLEGKKETGSGKRPVSPHLQPEPRLKCSSQHRRPMTHIEADKAPARVSEPSAG